MEVVEADAEAGEVALRARRCTRAISCLGLDALCLRAQHDRRAVGVVGADVDAVVAAQLLEADPDVGLDVLDHVAEVDRAVGVGQRAGDEDAAGHGLSQPSSRSGSNLALLIAFS